MFSVECGDGVVLSLLSPCRPMSFLFPHTLEILLESCSVKLSSLNEKRDLHVLKKALMLQHIYC
jgi:hypothetical protein